MHLESTNWRYKRHARASLLKTRTVFFDFFLGGELSFIKLKNYNLEF